MIKHYDLVSASINRLKFSEDTLDVVERFQLVGRTVNHVASIAGNYRGYSLLPGFFPVSWCHWLAHHDGGWFWRASRIHAKVSSSPGHDEANVGVGHVIFA